MRLTPELRFKHFNDNWREFLLEELTKRNICYGVVQPGVEDTNGVKFIRGGDISDGKISKNLRIISKEITDKYQRTYLKGGELVMSLVGYPGETAIVPLDLKGANLARQVGLIDLGKTVSAEFVHQYISSPIGKKKLIGTSFGSAQRVVNIAVLKKFKVPLPSLPEQQKIASFLSAVDEKIQQLTCKKELLEQYKKGVMQQLFSGKLRFKDENGKAYPKWEEKKLGELADVRDGTHDSPKYYASGKPLITSKNLKEDGKISFDDVNYISDDDYNSINKRSGVTSGDILFGMIGTIGNPAIVTGTGFAIKNVALVKEGESLKNVFLLQYLKSDLTLRQFHTLNTGNTQKFVSLSTIRDLKILRPSLGEQQKIASFLSTLDSKIESVAAQIAHTQTFKKGLLQQMFV